MASNSSGLSRFLAKTVGQARFATLAVAGAMALASAAAAAAPVEVALVESVSGKSSGAEFMDYVQAGQIIRLGRQETIVLSYMGSCVRETITGGTVTVGTDWSEVQSGEVTRLRERCDAGKMELTTAQTAISGRTFRGPPQ
jgi:hypothetical protein